MPDGWEKLYACMNPLVNDAAADFDQTIALTLRAAAEATVPLKTTERHYSFGLRYRMIPQFAIEADLDWASATHTGFYSRYSTGAGVNDFHEPLGTAFAFRYINTGGPTSNLMVWKDTADIILDPNDDPVFNACVPYIYYAFDENEKSKARGGGGPSGFSTAEPNVIPFETQKVPLDVANWNGLMNNGWMLLVFDPSIPQITTGSNQQAWAAVQYFFGSYSTATEAATLGNVWCFPTDILPNLNTYQGVLNGSLNAAPTAP